MKERCSLAFMLVFLLLATYMAELVTPVVASSDIITVPEDHSAIQEAIDAASSGDTIVVQEGLYAEGRIYVYKPLTLIAEGRVIVDGLNTAMGVFFVTSHSVVIKGFIVKNGVQGITLWCSNNCEIEGNTVIDNLVGIRILHSSNNILRDNKVSNNSAGILVGSLYDSPDCSEYNTIERNIVEKNIWGGIGIGQSSHNVVKGNRATHNNYGIYLIFYSDYNTINENTITNNLEYGVLIFLSDYNVVKENTVSRNTDYGIAVISSHSNTMKENIVKGNAYGIKVIGSSSDYNTIKENKVLRNGEFDLYWDQIGYTTWIENKYKTKNW